MTRPPRVGLTSLEIVVSLHCGPPKSCKLSCRKSGLQRCFTILYRGIVTALSLFHITVASVVRLSYNHYFKEKKTLAFVGLKDLCRKSQSVRQPYSCRPIYFCCQIGTMFESSRQPQGILTTIVRFLMLTLLMVDQVLMQPCDIQTADARSSQNSIMIFLFLKKHPPLCKSQFAVPGLPSLRKVVKNYSSPGYHTFHLVVQTINDRRRRRSRLKRSSGMRTVSCSNPSRNTPKSLEQVVKLHYSTLGKM